MKAYGLLLIAALATAVYSAPAQQRTNKAAPAQQPAKKAAPADPLTDARDRQDQPALDRLARQAQQQAEQKTADAETQYRAALAWSYLGEVAFELKKKPAAQSAADQGLRDIGRALQLNPNNAEYYRVQAMLCGQAIPFVNLLTALSYGKTANDALTKGLQLNPKSSGLHVARGVGSYYLPESFGGGAAKSIADFQQAISLEPNNSEAYLWLGMAQRS